MRNIHSTLRHSLFLLLGLVTLFLFPGTWNSLAAATSQDVITNAQPDSQPTPAALQLRHDPTHAEPANEKPQSPAIDGDELKYRVATALARLQARKAARAQKAAQTETLQPAVSEPTAPQGLPEPAPVVTQEPSPAATAEPVNIAQEIPVADLPVVATVPQTDQPQINSAENSPLFSKALAKMEKIKARRIEFAQKSGIALPSQSGDLEKTSPTLSRLNQNLKAIINRLP